MSSLQWYLSKSVTGNGVLLQFLREIIPQWMDLIVRTFVVYLAWFYSAPSQFHTFSSSRAFQNGSFSVPLLIFFLPSFALSWLSHVFFLDAEEVNICILNAVQPFQSKHLFVWGWFANFCLSLALVTSLIHCLFLWDFIMTMSEIKLFIIYRMCLLCVLTSFSSRRRFCLSPAHWGLNLAGTPTVAL